LVSHQKQNEKITFVEEYFSDIYFSFLKQHFIFSSICSPDVAQLYLFFATFPEKRWKRTRCPEVHADRFVCVCVCGGCQWLFWFCCCSFLRLNFTFSFENVCVEFNKLVLLWRLICVLSFALKWVSPFSREISFKCDWTIFRILFGAHGVEKAQKIYSLFSWLNVAFIAYGSLCYRTAIL